MRCWSRATASRRPRAVSSLVRRLDLLEVIGAALWASAAGLGHRRIAAALGRPATTVRGWLRFGRQAAELRALATQLAHRLDADLGPIAPRSSSTADAVEALGVAAAAAVRRLGRLPGDALAGDLRHDRHAAALAIGPAVVLSADHAAVGAIITRSPTAASVDEAGAAGRSALNGKSGLVSAVNALPPVIRLDNRQAPSGRHPDRRHQAWGEAVGHA
jgi:uncharacterized protein YdbL (DUF1318 family)